MDGRVRGPRAKGAAQAQPVLFHPAVELGRDRTRHPSGYASSASRFPVPAALHQTLADATKFRPNRRKNQAVLAKRPIDGANRGETVLAEPLILTAWKPPFYFGCSFAARVPQP